MRNLRARGRLYPSMGTSSNGHNGFLHWADEVAEPPAVNGSKPSPRLADLSTAILDRVAAAERQSAAAEARAEAMARDLARLDSELRTRQAELDGERRAREAAEQARAAAERRLSDAREAVWRWLASLARTPFWRVRRALSAPPAELQAQPRLPAP